MIGTKVKVLTSQIFKDKVGIIKFACRKTITVDFDGEIGIYTINANDFEFLR